MNSYVPIPPLPTNFRMTHLVVVLQIHEWDLPLEYHLQGLETKLVPSMIVGDLHPVATDALQLSFYLQQSCTSSLLLSL